MKILKPVIAVKICIFLAICNSSMFKLLTQFLCHYMIVNGLLRLKFTFFSLLKTV